MKTAFPLQLLGACALLAGCAALSASPAPGHSLCDEQLYRTIRGTLGMIELRSLGTETGAIGMIPPMTTITRTRVVKGK